MYDARCRRAGDVARHRRAPFWRMGHMQIRGKNQENFTLVPRKRHTSTFIPLVSASNSFLLRHVTLSALSLFPPGTPRSHFVSRPPSDITTNVMSVCAAAVVPTSFHAGAGSKAPVATRCVTSCARGTTNANGVPTAKTHPDRSLSFTKTAPASRARGQSITTKALAEAASGKIKIQAPPNAEVTTEYWQWEGHTIRYTKSGDAGPPLVLVHGFGGNADHWRKNTPVLGKRCRVFAIDLLGYGFSSKPDPMSSPQNEIYNFENWSRQLRSFVDEVVKEPAFLACNSVGGVAGLQAAVDDNTKVKGVILLNISLRGLHVSKQPALAKPFIKLLQTTLRTTDVGRKFFGNVARAETVKVRVLFPKSRHTVFTDPV